MTDLFTQLRDYGRQIESDPTLNAEAPRAVDVGSRPPRPRLRRGLAWALASFALVLTVGGLFIALSGGNGQVVNQTTVPTPTTVATTAPTTTATTAPPTTGAASWEPITVEGTGDDVIEFAVPNNDPALLDITHDGSANFVVLTHTADNQDLDLLVDVIGAYQGTRPINFTVGETVGLIEVQADGAWTITARPLSEEEVTASRASGTGDGVLVMEIVSPSGAFSSAIEVTHDGESSFVVLAWTDTSDLLVNEIGPYAGTAVSPTGTVIYEIQADGAWTLKSN